MREKMSNSFLKITEKSEETQSMQRETERLKNEIEVRDTTISNLKLELQVE